MCTCAYLYSCEVSLCMYICVFVSVCRYLHACTHKYIHTRDWEGARESKKHSPGSLLAQPQEGQRGDGDIRGEQRQTGMMGC